MVYGTALNTIRATNPNNNMMNTKIKSTVHQTAHNYEIQSSNVLQNRIYLQMPEKDRNFAKMLVISALGEARLITFRLPKKSYTLQDLLQQVDVKFDTNTTIQCVENPGANIDFVVAVGFATQKSRSELISRAEQIMQSSRPDINPNSAATAPPLAANYAGQCQQTSQTSSSAVVPPKLLEGFLAVCYYCGFSGYDHARCERCRHVFIEPPKRVPCHNPKTDAVKNTSSTASGATLTNLIDLSIEILSNVKIPKAMSTPVAKKRKLTEADKKYMIMTLGQNIKDVCSSQPDSLAHEIAAWEGEIRGMDSNQAVLTRKIMRDAISRGCMKTLNNDCHIFDPHEQIYNPQSLAQPPSQFLPQLSSQSLRHSSLQ